MGAYVKGKIGGEHTDLNSAPPLTDETGAKIANDDNQFTNAVLGATVGLATDSGPEPIGLYAKGEIGVEGFFGSSNKVDSFTVVTATDCGFLGTGTTDCGAIKDQMDGTASLHGLAFVLQASGGLRAGPVRLGGGVNVNYRGYLDSLAPVSHKDQDGNVIVSKDQAEIRNTLSPIGFNLEAEYLTPSARANTGGWGFGAEARVNPWGSTEVYDDGDQDGLINLTSHTTNLQIAGAATYYFGAEGASDADALSDAQLEELRARAEEDEKSDLTETLKRIAKDKNITVEALLAKFDLQSVDVTVTTEEVHGQEGQAVAMRKYHQPSLTFMKYYWVAYTDGTASVPGRPDADKSLTKDELIAFLKGE